MARRLQLLLIFLVFLALTGPVYSAQALRFDSFRRGDRDITVYVGFGANHKVPEATKNRYAFDILKLRYAKFTSPRTQLAFSAAYGYEDGSDDNSAIWSTISYRRYFLVRGRTALGYDASFGLMRFKRAVDELGTKTNFTEQLGLTLDYGITSSSSLSLEYTFSHTSNAGIRLPNIGINASMLSLGYSWFR